MPERGAGSPESSRVPGWLQTGAAWSWRLLLLAAAIYLVVRVLGILYIVVVPCVAALLLTALLQPLTGRLRRAGLPALAATWGHPEHPALSSSHPAASGTQRLIRDCAETTGPAACTTTGTSATPVPEDPVGGMRVRSVSGNEYVWSAPKTAVPLGLGCDWGRSRGRRRHFTASDVSACLLPTSAPLPFILEPGFVNLAPQLDTVGTQVLMLL